MSRSVGYSFFFTRVPLAEASTPPAAAAAPLACITVSGMSLGPENAPQTKMPGREVESGDRRSVLQKP